MTIPVAEAPAPHAAPPPPPQQPLMSRVVDTFFSPGKVFEGFREGKAPWLGPVLVSIVVMIVIFAVRPLFISDQQMAEFAIEKMREMGAQQTPTPEEMAGQMAMQTAIGGVFTIAWLFIRVGLVGLILFGIYALALGGRNDIRPYMAVTSHAFLVSTLGYLVLAALQYATGRLDLTLDAALLVPGADSGGLLVKILHGITPFGLWLVALLALGGATINRRKGWLGVAALLFALQMVMVTAFAMVAQMMAGRNAAG